MNHEPLYYEDLELGTRWNTDSRKITDSDVASFAELSGDFNPIHVDDEFAAQTQFGERIAHGALVIAIATGLRQQEGRLRGTLKAWLGVSDWRFQAPVRIGDTIHVENEVSERRPTRDPATGLITQRVEVKNQHDETVASGSFATLVQRRSLESADG